MLRTCWHNVNTMKSIRTFKHFKKKDDRTPEGVYNYYDIESNTKKTLTLQELQDYSNWLPHRCKEICVDVKHTKRPLTSEESSMLLLLCSLSLYCWGGYPKKPLIGISSSDYATDFYIQMVHQLSIETKSGWSPERGGRWASYVKWVRLKTMPVTLRRWEVIKSGAIVRNYHSVEDSIENPKSFDGDDVGYDLESILIGTRTDNGRKVNNVDRQDD